MRIFYFLSLLFRRIFPVSGAASEIEAQYQLGMKYFYGDGIAQDHDQALKILTKPAQKKHAPAQVVLAALYHDRQNYAQARFWLEKAAAQEYAYGLANLGNYYRDGLGVSQNYPRAFELYAQAAKQNIAEAQMELGRFYHNGWGVAQDYDQARFWFEKAALQGNRDALTILGDYYRDGLGVAQDTARALDYYSKAAK